MHTHCYVCISISVIPFNHFCVSFFFFFFFLMIRRPPRSTLFSLHDALPISGRAAARRRPAALRRRDETAAHRAVRAVAERSEEHTSELQSRRDLVCRLLLEKKKKQRK